MTGWVEAYYELFHGEGGQFLFKYREWHAQYGPIIRISPHEVHIQDSSFYETLFSTVKPARKMKSLEHRFNNPMSAFATSDHNVHRIRRGALNPFFSKRKIAERAVLLQDHIDELCHRLKSEFQNKDRILVVNDMWSCWTLDIITEYLFERHYNFIREPNFKASLVTSLFALLEPVHWITQFPWAVKMMYSLPDSFVGWMSSDMKDVISFNNEMTAQVKEALAGAAEKEQPDTIFTSIIQSDIPRSEVTVDRLQHEAISVVGAGIETTMRTLTISVFHIVDNPEVYRKLGEELKAAIPNPDKIPAWEDLEKLPFLTACIQESLRLAYGTSQRIPRIFDQEEIAYKDYVLPRGSIISMDIYDVSHDESIFPDSFSYKPERWLGNPRAPDGRQLSRYLVTFGRGTRSCVGLQLAWAELYVGLASLFRRFELEIYETNKSDVELARDRFVPRPVASSKGVRFHVK
ncbi:cytochrome protein [Diaporthe sp. PMI_573]|nr:cytochrome protein [Diaporthaceae sp. PMI_573]